MEKTTLYIAGDLHRQLQELAKREKRSQAQLIREALTEYLAAKSRPWPKSIGAGEDSEISGRDVKDWLRANWRPV
jgi:predicted transcriptional regulator